ncbi:MAG TPA: VanZ family protein [Vicinamibacterales bacterium]|nr:VanZ family protein [Vicinamibacterales bacterium]
MRLRVALRAMTRGQGIHLRAAPFVLAGAVAAALVLSAPFVGQIRSDIRRAFPGQFVWIVGGIIAAGVAGALVAALVRIRERRLPRYAAIAAALTIAAAYSTLTADPNPESRAVERFHFLQYGLITFLFYRAWRPLGDLSIVLMPLLAGLIVSTAEEWLQWFIPNRVGEMKDVFLNLVAIGTGLLFSAGIEPPERFSSAIAPAARPRLGRMAAAAILSFAAFLHVVHLGHRIHDGETGTFESRYTRDRLIELQAERAVRWRVHPPPTRLVRLSREDQYLTEGIQHVRERNRKWSEGDIAAAWLENRILEKYYEPVLDTPTHEGPSGHRWAAEQRADARSRAGGVAAAAYVSDAYKYPVFTWPKPVFWVVVLLICGGVVYGARPR